MMFCHFVGIRIASYFFLVHYLEVSFLKKKNVFATEKSASVSRVDIGGTTYVETRQGILERMYDHQTRTVVK